jgi:protein SCO1/2
LAVVALAAALVAAATTAQAQEARFRTNDISNAGFQIRGFALTDHHGKPRTLADFAGKAVVVFFGFTSCPDICPTGLAELAATLRSMGKDSERVQVLFITLDPERDTPAVLRSYVSAFHPSFLGLRGDLAETAKTAKEFRVHFRKLPVGPANYYTVDHSTHGYVFGPDARIRLYLRQGVAAQDLAHDLKLLLEQR